MSFRLPCHLVLIFLAALEGESRYLEVRDAGESEPFLLLDAELKRELSDGQIYRRALRCLDMLSIDGQFTFTAEQPQLHCATFFIGEPEELITMDFDFVNIDCQAGDFLKAKPDQRVLIRSERAAKYADEYKILRIRAMDIRTVQGLGNRRKD
ncbi:UNVERIFIED_CONTAM: hypothetical protein K2H54_060599 [Gekko kuhli]